MRRARVSTVLVCLFAPLLLSTAAPAAIGNDRTLALDSNPIRGKQPVPDDPLAGLPSEDFGRPGRGKGGAGAGKGANACKVEASPASVRDIGDLRAALAFVQRGPKSWPCPPRAAGGGFGLRIAIDGTGKITAVESAMGDPAVASAMAKKLAGKSIGPRAQGATTGTVLLTFAGGKGR